MIRRLLIADSVRSAEGTHGDAVLIEGDHIRAVGNAEELRSADLAEERFPGATIIPGLRDAHLHPVGHAASLRRPSLKEAGDFDESADILNDAARDLPPGAALTALRLDDESLAEGLLPDRDFLDRVTGDRPTLLIRYCGHVSVANSAALALGGLDDGTPDPEGGSMDRDSSGRLTGVLRETAGDPVAAAVREVAAPITTEDLITAGRGLAATGLVGVGAMLSVGGGIWAGAGSELDVAIDAAGGLPVTYDVMVIARTPADLESAADRVAAAGSRLRWLGVKMFSDGSFGGHTAAMHEGFSDLPEERGTDRLDPEWALEMARTSLRLGGNVAIHAIGDRANGTVLDLMETLIDEGADPSDLRIEHASVLTPGDIERFGRISITASVQPAFLASETEWLEKRMGPERLLRTYPLRSLRDAGTPLAGGSDSPVEPPHPLWGMAAARDRCGIVPAEGLAADEALALFTSGAAAAVRRDAGLEPGTEASLTVLDVDPVEATPDELRSASVLAAFVEGDEIDIDAPAWAG